MRRDSRDPGKGESRISPLFQPWPSRNKKRDSSQRLGDAKQSAQLLRIADASEAFDGRLRSRQVSEARPDSGRCYQHRGDPVNHFLCHTFRALRELKAPFLMRRAATAIQPTCVVREIPYVDLR